VGVEIEAKMALADPDALEVKLTNLGAQWVCQLHETNTYFDRADGSLKKSDQGLRIRIEKRSDGSPPVTIVTHKGPAAPGNLKTRSETQLHVADSGGAAALLAALGYKPVLTFEKQRRRWRLEQCLVEIDTLPYLGGFVEIEGPGEEAVMAVRVKLGLGDSPLIKTSYIAMLCDHMRKEHLDASHLALE
jgi:predicted adenylyl cyclase CyaB